MKFRQPTKPEILLWSVIIIALVCIITLSMTREGTVIAMPEPYVGGFEATKSPGTEDLPKVRHEPSKFDLPRVKKMGDDVGLKKE